MSSIERISGEEAGDETCIFCSITKGKAEASIVEKDDRIHVIISLEGTPLIIPNKHIVTPEEDPSLATAMFEKSIELAPAICRAYGTDSYNIVSNVGKAAGQEVNHFHTHIIPRKDQDRFVKFAYISPKPRGELNVIANRIIVERSNQEVL